MCGRVVQVSDPIRLAIVDGLSVRDSQLSNYPRRDLIRELQETRAWCMVSVHVPVQFPVHVHGPLSTGQPD